MQVTMIGIDHSRASIEYRELFSFTKAQTASAMIQIKEEFGAEGCLLLSTCNRTELWISGEAGERLSPYDMLCQAKNIDKTQYESFFVQRSGGEAVDHLFRLGCGLTSRLFGEDQIISQVRDALALSRECGCEDMVIEKLFQSAIAAAKRVKSTVRLTAADQSTAVSAIRLLKEKLGGLSGTSCLVIGNGQMGRLVANALIDCGGEVSMTLRKRIHGKEEQDSIVPQGCRMISYDERLLELPHTRVVISATLSPHYTISREDVEGLAPPDGCVWLDLAVPRDIEPSVSQALGIRIYDIDSLSETGREAANEESVRRALEILEEEAGELERWFAFREEVPQVKRVAGLAAEDVQERLSGALKELAADGGLQGEAGEALCQAFSLAACASAERAVGKILYGLRDTLSPALWESCMDALERAALRDTLKTGAPRRDALESDAPKRDDLKSDAPERDALKTDAPKRFL